MKIEGLLQIGNFSILEKLDQNFGEDQWIFIGGEMKEVFGKQYAVDQDCFRFERVGGEDRVVDFLVFLRKTALF